MAFVSSMRMVLVPNNETLLPFAAPFRFASLQLKALVSVRSAFEGRLSGIMKH